MDGRTNEQTEIFVCNIGFPGLYNCYRKSKTLFNVYTKGDYSFRKISLNLCNRLEDSREVLGRPADLTLKLTLKHFDVNQFKTAKIS